VKIHQGILSSAHLEKVFIFLNPSGNLIKSFEHHPSNPGSIYSNDLSAAL